MTNTYDIAFWEANQGSLDSGPAFNIEDSAVNISGALDALNADTDIASIIVQDNAAVVFKVGQLLNDTAVLSKLVNADNSTLQVTVKDLAARIGNNFASIATEGQVTSIVVSDNAAVQLSASQITNNVGALALIQNANASPANVTLLDSAAHIAFDGTLDAVQAHLSIITSIVVSNSVAMTLTAAQIANDEGALALVTNNNSNPVSFKVADTGAHIGANLDALEANFAKITQITDSDSAAITLNIAQFTSDIDALNLVVNANASAVSFIVNDTATHIAGAFNSLNGNASVTKIIVNDGPGNEVTLSAANAVADTTAESRLFQSNGSTAAHVAVSDTAAHIAANLNALNGNGHVDKITISNSQPLTLSVLQLTSDTTALGEIVGPYTINIKDTAAHISAGFDTLSSTGQVVKITVTDSASHEVSITAAQAGSDGAALSELFQSDGTTPANVRVTDTAANISTNLNALQGNLHVDKIVVSDSATNEVQVSVAQLSSDAGALAELLQADATTPANVAVSDTANNIQTALTTLNGNGQVNKIIVSNSASSEVVVTVAQLGTDSTALAELFKADGVTHATVQVSDTAAHLSTAFDSLNSNTQVDRIFITDSNALTLTVFQLTVDTTALSEIVNGSYAINIGDTAADISANFDALNNNTHVTKIIVSDSASHEVTITAAQAGSDGTALNELFQSDATTPAHVAVSDTAAHITTALGALNGNSHVDKIIVSDSGSNEVQVSIAQITNDATALGELKNLDGTTKANVIVSDTAVNITGDLDNLQANSQVNKIVVNNSGADEVQVNVAQLTSDEDALGELFNANGTDHASVRVDDTAVDISSAFDALNNNTQVNKIIVDNGPHHIPQSALEVTISDLQFRDDTRALSELVQINGSQANVAVADTAANISNDLDNLNNSTQVDHIIITDEGPITVTVMQALHDSKALGELQNGDNSPVTLEVNDTASAISGAFDALNAIATVSSIVISDNAPLSLSAVNIGTDTHAISILSNADSSGVEINVTDTGANISTWLDALQANTDIISITVSDNAPITVSVNQINTDSVVLGELENADNSSIQLTVQDTAGRIRQSLAALGQNSEITKIVISNNLALNLTIAQLTNVSDAHALSIMHNANGTPYQLIISDNAANISGALDSLSGNTHVTSIVVTDNAALTVTVAQITSDATALGETTNANAPPNAPFYTLSVHDTAADISAAFDALNGNNHVVKIIVTDSATNEVTITATQVPHDPGALAELFEADGTTQAHVLVNDTAANISLWLGFLDLPQVDKIIVSDSGSNEVVVNVAQITIDSAELAKLYDSDATTLANIVVQDNAPNLTTALDNLNTNTQVNKIVVSNSGIDEVQVSVAQLSSDATALAELFNFDGTTHANVRVSDTAANITTALNGLNTNTQVNKIVVSDSGANEVVVNVAQLSSDSNALGELFNSDGATPASVTVKDIAANIQGTEFDALNANTQVNKIIVSDSATNQLVLGAAQIANDAHALSELFNSNGTTSAHVKVVDTAANISTFFDALNSSQVSKITITNSTNHEVTITVAELTSDFHAISVLFQSDGTTPANVAVSDTAADISAGIGNLNSNSHVDKIFISDGNPLTLTVAQVTNDTTALGRIQGPYQVSINDTAAHVSASLDALEANNSIVSIVVTDNKPVTVNVAQLTSDANVISVMTDANNPTGAALLKVVDTAANLQAALGNLHADLAGGDAFQSVVVSDNTAITVSVVQVTVDGDVLSLLRNANGQKAQLTVSDTAAHVQAGIDALQAFNNSPHAIITSVVITNSQVMTFSAQQISNDAGILAVVTNLNNGPVTFKVSDTAANISAHLTDLQANGHLGTVTITDNAAVGVNVAQLSADATVLSKLHDADSSPYKLVVTDTASDISSALATLHNNTHVTKVVVSDSGSGNEVHFSNFQLANDANVLSELFNSDGTTPAHVVLADSNAHLSAMSVAQIQALAGENVNHIDSTTDAFTWDLAQYEALGTVTLTQADTVTLNDSAGNFAGLSDSDLSALATNGIDKVVMTGSGDFSLDTWDALTTGQTLSFTTTAATIKIDGTLAADTITTVGSGAYTLVGGAGADIFNVNAAAQNTFEFDNGSDSTSTGYDTIHGFNGANTTIISGEMITENDGVLNHSTVNTATFDTDLTNAVAGHLDAEGFMFVKVTSGTLSGHTFLVVDENGTAGYQSGDLVVDVTGGTHLTSLTTSHFETLS